MPYRQNSKQLEELVKTNVIKGLSKTEAQNRLSEYGTNTIEMGKKKTIFSMLLEQLSDPMVLILIVGAIISIFLHEIMDSAIIFTVIVLNAVIGVVQEFKAEKALESLEKLSTPLALVIRDEITYEIPSTEVVVGDILCLESGKYVPADIRLIESTNLKTDESSLTGESLPVDKDASILLQEETTLAERKNMCFASTFVTSGKGKGIVIATGMDSEIGKIAKMLHQEETLTPLQIRLAYLGKVLGILSLAICVIIFVISILQKRDVFEMLLTAISLAVAAIPEGLPAVVTIALALGVQKMSKNNAIVRKLQAVETLGSVSVICSDKTGTLTQNKMTVTKVFINQSIVDDNISVDPLFVQGFALCNDTKVQDGQLLGEPTEKALMKWAIDQGIDLDKTLQEYKRVFEIPFDSKRKLMTTIYQHHNKYIAYTKGAIDVLLSKCTRILIQGEVVLLTKTHRDLIESASNHMSEEALRVLALAYKSMHSIQENCEYDLTFVGLAGMIDPPRVEAIEAIQACHKAHIKVVMITGDHPQTALAIGKQMNLVSNMQHVISGSELDEMSDDELKKVIGKYRIFARVTPLHKVRIVDAFRSVHGVVAMTGDGVNDAPSLKKADVGIAMGSGTDVSKQAADLILTDDNFATIVKAVEEGRNIYSNIQKAILYLLSCNLGEITTLFLAIVLMRSAPTPLTAIQILWVNLITDAFPALALTKEPKDKFIMSEKPRKTKESIFGTGGASFMILNGLYIGVISLVAYRYGLVYDTVLASTMCFMVLSISQLFHCLNLRSIHHSIFKVGVFKNKYLIITLIAGILIQVFIVMSPVANRVLNTTPLELTEWMIVFGLSFSMILINEIAKWFGEKFNN